MTQAGSRVALFVTCLVDLFRPRVGFAAVKLLEDAGCAVEVPQAQACCGQPGHNAGDRASARRIAAQVIEAFEGYDYTVVPSGSCAGMIKLHYPQLFEDDVPMRARAERLAARTHELVAFLVDVRGMTRVAARADGVAAYHDSCSGLRELGISAQPRRLLGTVEGLGLREIADNQACCGFGGTFCVKYPEISERMVADKTKAIDATGADMVLAGDLGCLLNIAGRIGREGGRARVRHVAEVLAGMADGPAIGQGER